jgi:hypothetical protein
MPIQARFDEFGQIFFPSNNPYPIVVEYQPEIQPLEDAG